MRDSSISTGQEIASEAMCSFWVVVKLKLVLQEAGSPYNSNSNTDIPKLNF